MKIRIYSDLHLEFEDWTPPEMSADVVILAGDIHVGSRAFAWARRNFKRESIIYIPGNHEFFGATVGSMLVEMRHVAGQHDIHFLDQDAIVLDGVRFLGTTLWTDFGLYGSEPEQIEAAMRFADTAMNDYRSIKVSSSEYLQPEHTRQMHLAQARWLKGAIDAPFGGPTVVVTHHLPHLKSVHSIYEGERTNPAFASDLSSLFRDHIKLWVHGHTHESIDYEVGGTRVVCNPRGYLPKYPNANFNPLLTASIKR